MISSVPFSPYRIASIVKTTGFVLFALCFCHLSWGAVSLNVTRVIMDHDDKEANVRIKNESRYPVLIQGWIDTGDAYVAPEKIQVPFVITSPMFRLGPDAAQNLRIIFTGAPESLPSDRESVFWLNIQEIPPNLFVENNENHMQIAFRTRIKLFYRPVSIPQNTDSLHEQLTFSIVEENSRSILQIDNPTAIHISLLEIIIGNTDYPIMQLAPKESMVKPFGTLRLPVVNLDDTHEKNTQVTYFFLNDFGVSLEKKTKLISPP